MFHIPATVPTDKETTFQQNYQAITHNNKIFLFAVDHKIEHMNEDFHGHQIPQEANDPETIFKIASQGNCHAFATHLGLIARYGKQYPNLNFIVKMNGKTNIIPKAEKDPISQNMWSVDDIIRLQEQSQLNIKGVGYTIYLGSKYEEQMLAQAAQNIYQAHKHGLVTFLWAYPRGQFVKNENDAQTIAGAAGVANSLGADFVKIQIPKLPDKSIDFDGLKTIVQAAGNTQVICAGGSLQNSDKFLHNISEQINSIKTSGIAAGRNIFQLPFDMAVDVSQKIAQLIKH